MSDLGSLVTDVLAGGVEEEGDTLLDDYEHSLGGMALAQMLLDLSTEMRERDFRDSEFVVREVSAVIPHCMHRSFADRNSGEMLSIMLFEYMERGTRKNFENIERLCRRIGIKIETSTFYSAEVDKMDYLLDIFQEDLTGILSEITGCKKATAASWVREGRLSDKQTPRVNSFAGVVFKLERYMGWDKDEIREWVTRPLSGGETPPKTYSPASYGHYCYDSTSVPDAIARYLKELDKDIFA